MTRREGDKHGRKHSGHAKPEETHHKTRASLVRPVSADSGSRNPNMRPGLGMASGKTLGKGSGERRVLGWAPAGDDMDAPIHPNGAIALIWRVVRLQALAYFAECRLIGAHEQVAGRN